MRFNPIVIIFLFGSVFSCVSDVCGAEGEFHFFAVSSAGSKMPEMVFAANSLAKEFPQSTFDFMTTDQFLEIDDETILERLTKPNTVVILSMLFADLAQKMERILSEIPEGRLRTVFIFACERSLYSRCTMQGRYPFHGFSAVDIDRIMDYPNQYDRPLERADDISKQHPDLKTWVEGWKYTLGKGPENYKNLMLYLLSLQESGLSPEPPRQTPSSFIARNGIVWEDYEAYSRFIKPDRKTVGVLDLDSYYSAGNFDLHQRIVEELEKQGLNAVPIVAAWAEPTAEALRKYAFLPNGEPAFDALISLQTFLLGGAQSREDVDRLLIKLGVPVFRAVRVNDRTEGQWKQSIDGLPWEAVYHQIAIPEMQGIGEPMAVAAESTLWTDPLTGARLTHFVPIEDRIQRLSKRIKRWTLLQSKPNREKKVAVVYYNHPPGRQNIGADNLNVPESLYEILHLLKQNGYQTGELPSSPEELVKPLLERGANVAQWASGRIVKHATGEKALPVNLFKGRLNKLIGTSGLKKLAGVSKTLPVSDYEEYFASLPSRSAVQIARGPVAALWEFANAVRGESDRAYALDTIERIIDEIGGYGERILKGNAQELKPLLEKVQSFLEQTLERKTSEEQWNRLVAELDSLNLEGMNGWGPPPGKLMVVDGADGAKEFLIPGLEFGRVFIGPQPLRGWNANPEALHSTLAVPPPHSYLAFYEYIKKTFKADVVVHLGRHSTFEWLPGKQVALSQEDYPDIILDDLPSVYIYIVDGVGEGLQAKRRGLSTILTHLTPPLKTTHLYENLLTLRKLVENYQTQSSKERRAAVIDRLWELLEEKNLQVEIADTLKRWHGVETDDLRSVREDLLVHGIGHYLTELQEEFMPYGLHAYGRDWSGEETDMMAESIVSDMDCASSDRTLEKHHDEKDKIETLLRQSTANERKSLLDALDGGYISPSKGNDPIRTPDVLPTGRNFYAIDASLLPTKVSYELGKKLAIDAIAEMDSLPEKISAVLWCVSTVRDEGAMISYAMHMLGVEPVWNARGIVRDVAPIPPSVLNRNRIDVVLTTSGLFRDVYSQCLLLLDRAYRTALAQSAKNIQALYPELEDALISVLDSVSISEDRYGSESFEVNPIARHWVEETKGGVQQGLSLDEAGKTAILRIFSAAPEDYGVGINRIVDKPWEWKDRDELSELFLSRMAHGYSHDYWGTSHPKAFRRQLTGVQYSYHSASSNLYGILDNNDYYDYFGGLSMGIEKVNQAAPQNFILDCSNPKQPKIDSLVKAMNKEMRVRYFNPEWIDGMMKEGYSGARTISNKFVEYFWGWQVTNPEIVRDWMWQEISDVYIDDKYNMGVGEWLSSGDRAYAMQNIAAVMLTAAYKGFWNAPKEELEKVAKKLQETVLEASPVCSSYVCGNHPVIDWAKPYMDRNELELFERTMNEVTGIDDRDLGMPDVYELQVRQAVDRVAEIVASPYFYIAAAFALAVIVFLGYLRSKQSPLS